jgi:hypothetical protein
MLLCTWLDVLRLMRQRTIIEAMQVMYLHPQPTENYHSKSHSHGTKNMEVILDQKTSDVELVQVKLISW